MQLASGYTTSQMTALVAGVLALVTGCAERPLPATPLPALEDESRSRPQAIDGHPDGIAVGESLVWNLTSRGAVIGRARLARSGATIVSQARTTGLAAKLRPLVHLLTTAIDPASGRPRNSDETLGGGDHWQVRARFDGLRYRLAGAPMAAAPTPVHTAHTALAAVRGWARDRGPSGVLHVVHGDALYRVDVGRPRLTELDGTAALRVDAVVAGGGELSIWLSADDRRLPLQVDLIGEDETLTAELVDL